MLKPLKVWKRARDDIEVWGAGVGGITASMGWPWLLRMLFDGLLPHLAATDLVRLLGAMILSVIFSLWADKGTPLDQRTTPAAIRRRAKAMFWRGFGFQGAIAALTALAQGRAEAA